MNTHHIVEALDRLLDEAFSGVNESVIDNFVDNLNQLFDKYDLNEEWQSNDSAERHYKKHVLNRTQLTRNDRQIVRYDPMSLDDYLSMEKTLSETPVEKIFYTLDDIEISTYAKEVSEGVPHTFMFNYSCFESTEFKHKNNSITFIFPATNVDTYTQRFGRSYIHFLVSNKGGKTLSLFPITISNFIATFKDYINME